MREIIQEKFLIKLQALPALPAHREYFSMVSLSERYSKIKSRLDELHIGDYTIF